MQFIYKYKLFKYKMQTVTPKYIEIYLLLHSM